MNKWEERLCDKNDNRKLLIESSEFTSKIKLNKTLKESLVMQSGKNGTLIVKNVPVTILDRENLNGRIYSTETMRQAIEEAREAMADKQTLGQANEHPESSFVAPTDASHVIINAYIKENVNIVVDGKRERHNVLFTDWEVLNTTHGKDLRALFEAECSFGTSIRGVGELSGKMVQNYSFISVDGVGNPSSSTYTRMPVSESVKVEFKDANELKENYTVMSSSTNVVRDLSQAGILQQQLNANPYGTITKTSTKVDQETDPKTGAQTSITTVEADTEDEVTDLNQAFQMAHKAMTNGISKVNSVTIEANEDEDEQGNKTESVDMSDNGLEAYVPESAPVEEGQVVSQGQSESTEITEDGSLGLKQIVDLSGVKVMSPDEKELWRISDELRKAEDKNVMEWQRSYKSLVDAGVDQIYLDYANGKDMGEGYAAESTITESKKEEPKDPNEGRQYVLKIKNNDPEMKEDSDNAPEFVAMRGNAIRFTKDPKKALHFTQGMEESGIVHCSNIKKLLADMGYGEQNLEKWYKKDNGEVAPKKEGIIGGLVSGALSNDDKKESAQLTEDGNTKYSANIEVINKGGLPETKSLQISSNDLEGALKEVSNHWQQQQASNDVNQVNSLTLVDNQSGEKFNYDPKSNQLLPVNGSNVQQQPAQQTEEPKIMEPDDVELGVKEESVDGEIKQNNKTLDMDIDDNTHVEKEFDTKAQASVAKAGIESGKLSGDVLLSDAVDDDWKICVVFDKLNYDPDKIRVTLHPQEVGNADHWVEIFSLARNKLKDKLGISGHPHVASFDVFDSNEQFEDGIQDLPESTKNELKPGWYVAHDKIGISGPYETREACMEGLEDYKDQVSVYEVTENDLNEVLFKNPSEPSDDYVEKPLEEDHFFYDEITPRDGDKGGYSFKGKNYNISAYRLDDSSWEMRISNKNGNPVTEWHKVECNNDEELFDMVSKAFDILDSNASNGYAAESFDEEDDETIDLTKPWNITLYNPHDNNVYFDFQEQNDGNVKVTYSFKVSADDYETDSEIISYENAKNLMGKLNNWHSDPNFEGFESVNESSLVPVRFSNIKWDEKDVAYRMFEDIEKDMQVSHIEPNVNNADVLVEYFDSYMDDLKGLSIDYNVNPNDIKESVNYQNEILEIYNQDKNRQYPKIKSADINLR